MVLVGDKVNINRSGKILVSKIEFCLLLHIVYFNYSKNQILPICTKLFGNTFFY